MPGKAKGSRKTGRGARSAARAAYKSMGKRDRNKVVRILKHIKTHPNDMATKEMVDSVGRFVKQGVVDYKTPRRVDPRLAAQQSRDKQWQTYLKEGNVND